MINNLNICIRLLLGLLFLTACSENQENAENTKPDAIEIYPSSYRSDPEIYDMNELQLILELSDKVTAYNINDRNRNTADVECEDLYDPITHELCPSAINKTVLSKDQVKKLTEITSDTSTYNGKWSGIAGTCYLPHHAFGFYQNDSLIAQLSVCFMCSKTRTRPYYKSDGLSQVGSKKYRDFIKSIGLDSIN